MNHLINVIFPLNMDKNGGSFHSYVGHYQGARIMTQTHLCGGFNHFNPCEEYESQLGCLFPIYGKMKSMFQSPPTSHDIPFHMLNHQRVISPSPRAVHRPGAESLRPPGPTTAAACKLRSDFQPWATRRKQWKNTENPRKTMENPRGLGVFLRREVGT